LLSDYEFQGGNFMSNMVVATNVLALNSHRNLKTIGTMQTKSSARLSSGYKINSAADDAAGLAISEKMRSQIRGLDQASKNTQDGVSLIQTAEGGMQEIDNMLQRIRELVNSAANDTNENNYVGTGDRTKIQDEINQLISEIDSMKDRVEFNKKKVLNGTYANVSVQIKTVSAQLGRYRVITGAGGSKITGLSQAVQKANAGVGSIQGKIAGIGASIDILTTMGSSATVIRGLEKRLSTEINTNLKAAKTALASVTTYYNQVVTMDKIATGLSIQKQGLNSIASKGTTTLHFQIGANANQSLMLNIGSFDTQVLGIGDGKGNSALNIEKSSGAQITGYLSVLDNALSYVTSERSKMGAAQNRLEYTQKSLDVSSENLSAAESRIRDTDMAKEMMTLTKANVLQQAATSMLAQANQAPQNVLQLLG